MSARCSEGCDGECSLACELADMRARSQARRAASAAVRSQLDAWNGWEIARRTGLPVGDVLEALNEGRTPAELLALAPRRRAA